MFASDAMHHMMGGAAAAETAPVEPSVVFAPADDFFTSLSRGDIDAVVAFLSEKPDERCGPPESWQHGAN